MQADKFYQEIQEKIEHANLEPTWNKADVWQRIEQKNTKKKPLIVWWKAVAASVALIGAAGIYFSSNTNKVTDNQAVATNTVSTETPTNVPTLSKSIQSVAVPERGVSQKFTTKQILVETPADVVTATPNTATSNASQSIEKQEVAVIEKVELAKSDEIFTEKNSVEKSSFVANQAILDVRIPKKRERVAILEIPDDYEGYNAPNKEKKKGYLARLTKKKAKNAVEETEELPSINGKPNKVWAFVKESFKNETMAVDSTNK
jgi:hypothetical protein